MTSHKEQPAVDTSAEKLMALSDELDRALGWDGSHISDRLRDAVVDVIEFLRSLAAHPAEPAGAGAGVELETTAGAGVELETTAEERAQWLSWGDIHLSTVSARRLLRDFDRMRARADALAVGLLNMQEERDRYMSMYEAEKMASGWIVAASLPSPDANADFTPEIAVKTIDLLKGELARGAPVIRRLYTQLRDAQARGKGMEEALKPFGNLPPECDIWFTWPEGTFVVERENCGVLTVADFVRARAAFPGRTGEGM